MPGQLPAGIRDPVDHQHDAHGLAFRLEADALRPPGDGVGDQLFRRNQPHLGEPGVRGQIDFISVESPLKEDIIYLFFVLFLIVKIVFFIASSAENHGRVLFMDKRLFLPKPIFSVRSGKANPRTGKNGETRRIIRGRTP